ncbi:MAG: L-threonylcarbamoyladenylate synthase [Clostridia bacterium]|nr:L-threonylcarbamoyladenylate synthase [Clostridia bacterium]
MKYDTQMIKVDPDRPEPEHISKAALLIGQGEVVAFPTETVYGLGANALDEQAVQRIFQAKGRPSDNPLIVHISDKKDIYKLAREVPQHTERIVRVFWPGPLTFVLKKSKLIPDSVTGGLDSVAIRMPSHPVAHEIIKTCRLPIAAPSANISGRPSPTTAQHVLEDMRGKIPLIIDGGKCDVGLESTVLDMTGDVPEILRPGGITPEQLKRVLGQVKINQSVLSRLDQDKPVKSPGMKYKHYSPRAKVIIISGELEKLIPYINHEAFKYQTQEIKVGIMATEQTKNRYKYGTVIASGDRDKPETIAANLFDVFRKFDDLGMDIILAEAVSTDEIGLAIMNRMGRAAAFNIIKI